MNITFLIGNGFDLNLGLKTSFSNFIEQYKSEHSSSSIIERFKKEIQNDEPLWSNAEIAFGQYTKFVSNASDYLECHLDFCTALGTYLKQEEERIKFNALREIIPKLFAESIQSFRTGFREKQQERIRECIAAAGNGFVYNFINFNYTSTLDRCIHLLKTSSGYRSLLGTRIINNRSYDNSIGQIEHIHGFTDRDMILGVNDETQIANANLFAELPPIYIAQIIKRKANQIINENQTDEKCLKLLKSSDLIYIYGMSIGKTDILWWRRICELLKDKSHARVIIYIYDAPKEDVIRTKYVIFEQQKKEEFVSYSQFNDILKSKIIQRIHITNQNIFQSMSQLVNHKADTSTMELITT